MYGHCDAVYVLNLTLFNKFGLVVSLLLNLPHPTAYTSKLTPGYDVDVEVGKHAIWM